MYCTVPGSGGGWRTRGASTGPSCSTPEPRTCRRSSPARTHPNLCRMLGVVVFPHYHKIDLDTIPVFSKTYKFSYQNKSRSILQCENICLPNNACFHIQMWKIDTPARSHLHPSDWVQEPHCIQGLESLCFCLHHLFASINVVNCGPLSIYPMVCPSQQPADWAGIMSVTFSCFLMIQFWYNCSSMKIYQLSYYQVDWTWH